MRVLLSSLITILLSISTLGVFFENSISDIASVLLVLLNIYALILFKNKRLVFLLFITCLLSFVNLTKDTVITSTDKDLINVDTTYNDNVENRIQSFQIKLLSTSTPLSKSEITIELKTLTDFAISKATTSNPKSFFDLARAYEIATILGVEGAGDNAYTNYVKYCELDPLNSECYAAIAKFLALDDNQKKNALRFAQKALNLSKTKEDALKYNALVEYLSK